MGRNDKLIHDRDLPMFVRELEIELARLLMTFELRVGRAVETVRIEQSEDVQDDDYLLVNVTLRRNNERA